LNVEEIAEVRRLLAEADKEFEEWLASLDWIDAWKFTNGVSFDAERMDKANK
jgi:hypothetical protein